MNNFGFTYHSASRTFPQYCGTLKPAEASWRRTSNKITRTNIPDKHDLGYECDVSGLWHCGVGGICLD